MSSVVRKEKLGRILEKVHEALAQIWSYNLGKVGLILLFGIVAVSIYALVTMPPGFADQWNSPQAWWNLPKNAPPAWLRNLGFQLAEHKVFVLSGKDAKVEYTATGAVVIYEVDYVLDVKDFPQRLNASVLVTKPLIGRTVSATLVVIRPDGYELKVAEGSIDFAHKGLYTIPANPDVVASSYYRIAREYGISPATYVKVKDEVALLYSQAIFGVPKVVKLPEGGAKIHFEPLSSLHKPYKIQLRITVRKGEEDLVMKSVGQVRIIVVGNCYGLLGTDIMNRDLALGILYGFPVALLIGFFAAVTATMIGMIVGVISGYYGGLVDEAIQRLIDVMANVPLLPVLVMVGAAIQGVIENPWHRLFILIAFIIAFSWGGVAIVVRSMTLSIKAEPYIEAARAIGASNTRIVFRHIIPQVIPYVFAVLVFSVPGAILLEAGLSILGIRHGLPTWGQILADARMYLEVSMNMWWWILPPGIMLALTSFTFVALGMTLETIVEPRLRRT